VLKLKAGSPRTDTRGVGWRLPKEVVSQVRTLAKREGTRPGKLIIPWLRQAVAETQRNLSAKELAGKVNLSARLLTFRTVRKKSNRPQH
jgi:hypothetical protein